MMTTINVNGEAQNLSAETLTALLAERGIEGGRGLAVALNGAVVPRANWPSTKLNSGDDVEIVHAKQGG
jgi:sulfur carrier protein